jgi:phi LC3 family holin
MKINWKVRFKNKVWLSMFLSLIVGFAFNMLKLFDVYPPFTENTVLNIVNQLLTFLGLIGVLIDPTTAGIEDSQRAMGYEEPWVDQPPEDAEG